MDIRQTVEVDMEGTLALILKNAVKALEGSAGAVATWSEAERRFAVSASYELDSRAIAQLRPLLNEAIPDLAGSRQSFHLLSQLRPEMILPSAGGGVRQDPIMALPLQIAGTSIGLIYVLRPLRAMPFSDADRPVLAAFASQAAIALYNAKLARLLTEEKRRVELVLENSPEGIMSVDDRCRITGFNRAMEKLSGFPREEALGKECSKILSVRDADGRSVCGRRCPMLMMEGDGGSTFEQEGKIQTKYGQEVDVAMAYAIVRSPLGKPLNAVVNIRDISRLREIENLRETFLSMLGHELQTPLSIIKGYANTLARHDSKWDKKTLQQSLQVIEEESDRLSRVVSRLLLASRISSLKPLTLEKEYVQLPSLASKVVHRLQVMTKIHTFEVNFEPDFPSVLAEPSLMEEVLSNLVENAIKYSPKGGKIAISGKVENGQAKIAVADEGIGVSEQEMESIFEPFRRGDSSLVHKIPGVGLGLHICRVIVEAHGGKIEASRRPGRGSEFSFTLPLENDAPS